jgi:NAD(P)-dependent dehydrogenase (short-subunit alcohol dehydrogenase family)
VERQLGPIEIFCSNAGVGGDVAPLTELRTDYFRWVLEVNVLGAVNGIQAVVPAMIERRWGRVLFTASMTSLSAPAMLADYAASKHALLAVADSLRQEVEPFGIRVTALCPAAVTTNLGVTTRRHTPGRLARNAEREAYAARMRASLVRSSGGAISPDAAAQAGLAALKEGRFLALTHPLSSARARARAAEVHEAVRELERSSGMTG